MDFMVWANMVFTLYNSCCANKAHFFFPLDIFSPCILLRILVFFNNLDSFSLFFFFFLEYSSNVIAERNDFLFLKYNH